MPQPSHTLEVREFEEKGVVLLRKVIPEWVSCLVFQHFLILFVLRWTSEIWWNIGCTDVYRMHFFVLREWNVLHRPVQRRSFSVFAIHFFFKICTSSIWGALFEAGDTASDGTPSSHSDFDQFTYLFFNGLRSSRSFFDQRGLLRVLAKLAHRWSRCQTERCFRARSATYRGSAQCESLSAALHGSWEVPHRCQTLRHSGPNLPSGQLWKQRKEKGKKNKVGSTFCAEDTYREAFK